MQGQFDGRLGDAAWGVLASANPKGVLEDTKKGLEDARDKVAQATQAHLAARTPYELRRCKNMQERAQEAVQLWREREVMLHYLLEEEAVLAKREMLHLAKNQNTIQDATMIFVQLIKGELGLRVHMWRNAAKDAVNRQRQEAWSKQRWRRMAPVSKLELPMCGPHLFRTSVAEDRSV